jgi:hypothetical protein
MKRFLSRIQTAERPNEAVAKNTRMLVFAAGFVTSAFALPLLLGEAAWAFGLLVAPLLLLRLSY